MSKAKNFIILILIFLSACNSTNSKIKHHKTSFSFSKIKGIKFIEIRRTFENGIAFDAQGFQQEPEWIIEFQSDTTVKTYSPTRKKMIDFVVTHSHDAVYNFAREWFRVKKISKDSLVLQRLQVNAKQIAKDIRSNVYMKFYSEDYIYNKLKTTPKQLNKTRQIDSAFVKNRAKLVNAKPMDSSLFFAARNPVVFTPSNKIVRIEKISSVNKLLNRTASYDYLYPEYTVTVNPAYKDFAYTISAIVDEKGQLFVYKFNAIDEFKETRKKVLQGILDVYISKSTTIKPGSTLGIPHATLVVLNLIGKK
jgi:hypothetical protein